MGVVGDVHYEGLAEKPGPEMYIPYGQVPNVEARPIIVARTLIEPTNLISALRKAVSEVDSSVPMDQIETMKQIVSTSVGQPRFRTAVLFVFALLAVFVAVIGLYGVMSYFMGQRRIIFSAAIALDSRSLDAGGDILPRRSSCVALRVEVMSLAQRAFAFPAAGPWTSTRPSRWRRKPPLRKGVNLPGPGLPLPPTTKRVTFQEQPSPVGIALFHRLAKAGWAKSTALKI